MAVVLNETFVGAAGDIDGRAAATGGTPTQYGGTYSTSTINITSNGNASNPTLTNEAAAYYYGSATPVNADYVVEAQITMSPAQIGSGQAFGVLGRCVIGTATWYGLMVYLDQLYMTVVVSGSTTFLTPVALTINDGDIWFVRLTMTGTTISGNARLSAGSYGAELISVTDSTITAKGVPGVMLNSANGVLNLLTVTDSASPSTFAADTWSGLGAAVSIAGRTASDGSSVWTAHSGGFLGNGAGGVYPIAGKFVHQLISIDNNLATLANQTITWTWKPTATPRLVNGVDGNGWSTTVAAKIRNAVNSQAVFAILDTASGSGGEIYLYENDAPGAFRRESTHSSYFTTLTVDIVCTLTIRKGVARLVCTGGATVDISLTLSILGSAFGGIGLSSYSPSSGFGGVDATNGVHTGPISALNFTGAATSYAILQGRNIYTATPTIHASKFPAAFGIFNPNVGNLDAGYAGNNLYSLTLDGVAPGGGFIFTPTDFTANGANGSALSPMTIAAGADVLEFALVPAVGKITDLAATGTNNAGYSNPTLTVNVRPKLAIIEGDSISSPAFGSQWPGTVQTTMGSTWLVLTSAREFSSLDDGTSVATASIKIRSPITIEPFHDATRTQEAVIIWAGTNDIYAGTSAATVYASLVTRITAIKAAGYSNISIVTMLPRDGSASPGGQSGMNGRKNTYNTSIKAGYGSTGTDTSVTVLDLGGDATIGGDTAFSNATYYPDGTHPHPSGASLAIIAPYFSNWLTSLPASQTAIAITGSASIAPGVATTYTFTPAGSITSTVTFSDGRTAGAGIFVPTSRTWTASAAAQTATYTAAGPNNVTLTGTGAGITVTGKAVTVAWTVDKKVIFLGDALTYGTGATPGTTDYATVAMTRLDASWIGTNYGVVGQSASMVASSPSQLASDAAARVHATRDNIVVAQWGTDDLRIGTTNTTLMNFYATIATAYRAAALAANPTGRFRFIAQTIQPGYSTGAGILSSYDLQVQQSWNAYLRANYAANGIDLVSDLASNPLVGQAGAETNATYFDADKVHMTAAGYALVAAIAATTIGESVFSPVPATSGVKQSSAAFDGGYFA